MSQITERYVKHLCASINRAFKSVESVNDSIGEVKAGIVEEGGKGLRFAAGCLKLTIGGRTLLVNEYGDAVEVEEKA